MTSQPAFLRAAGRPAQPPVSPYAIAAIVAAVLAMGLGIATAWVPSLIFLSVGTAALLIVLLPPALGRGFDLFSPWSFLALSVLLGLTVRGVYITLGYPDFETLDSLYFLGEYPTFFARPAVILLLGLLIVAISYMSGRARRARRHVLRHWNTQKLYLLACLALAVSLAGTFLYVKQTGGFESDVLSAKRTKMSHVDISDEAYGAKGTLMAFSSLAMFAHVLVLADLLRSTGAGRSWKLLLALALFLAACIVPFYGSDRSSIALNACMSAGMLYYSGRSFPLMRIVSISCAIVVAIHVMTVLRGIRDQTDVMENLSITPDLIASAVVNRNYIGLGKTSQIIAAVPETLELQYGKTIMVWLVVAVPRELWRDKPLIQSGPIVGDLVYGTNRSGVPPGYIAELYWNFQLPGVIIGCAIFGWLMRYLFERFRPVRGGDLFMTTIYVCGPMQFGFNVLGHSLGSGVFHLLLNMAVMSGFLWMIRDRRRIRPGCKVVPRLARVHP